MSARLMLFVSALAMVLAMASGIYWKGRHDDAVQQRSKLEAAQAQATVAGLSVQGARDRAQRVARVFRQREIAADAVTQLTAKALTSEDANAPLDPARAARLHDADRRLCDAAPELAGCAAGGDAG